VQPLLRILPRVAPFVLAASVLGATNLVFVYEELAERVQSKTLVATLLYDFALSAMLGTGVALFVGLAIELRRRVTERYAVTRTVRHVALGVAGALLGGQILARDLANAIATRGLTISPVLVGAVVGGGCVVALGVLFEHLRRPTVRWFALGGGLVLGALNAQILVADYPGIHFLIALSALTLVTVGISPGCRRLPSAALGAVPLLGVAVSTAVFVVPPSRVVRQGLLASSGSVVFPLLADQLAGRVTFTGQRLAIEN